MDSRSIMDVHKGDFVKIGNDICKVIEIEKKSGGAQFGSIVHLKYVIISTGHIHDKRFNSSDKVEIPEVRVVKATFSYSDKDTYYFLNPETYEQYELPTSVLGNYSKFIKEGEEVEIVLHEEVPIYVNIPDKIKVKVIQTGDVSSGTDKTVWKPAVIEGNIEIMVPGFIKSGDNIFINLDKMEYLGRE